MALPFSAVPLLALWRAVAGLRAFRGVFRLTPRALTITGRGAAGLARLTITAGLVSVGLSAEGLAAVGFLRAVLVGEAGLGEAARCPIVAAGFPVELALASALIT